MKQAVHLVRPGARPDPPLSPADRVVYIEADGRYRLDDGDQGRYIDPDELLDALFDADLVVTW